jgi:DNA-binding transcriptional ArsR family regulator
VSLDNPAGDVGSGLDATMRALRARTRREILRLIWDRELAAGEIASAFSVTAATISEHLAVLRAAGLVEMTRVGTSRRYRARPAALAGLHGALEGGAKWLPADDIPERRLAATSTRPLVVATVEVPTAPEVTFTAFTDPDLYSRWLQVPVSIADGGFAATMEWGTEVRGRYELVVPPRLIVLSWDFDDENVPVPGRSLTGYLRVSGAAARTGSRVEVHQLVDTPEQAAFMEAAWGLVLGRLRLNLQDAITGSGTARATRAKRTRHRAPTTRPQAGSSPR